MPFMPKNLRPPCTKSSSIFIHILLKSYTTETKKKRSKQEVYLAASLYSARFADFDPTWYSYIYEDRPEKLSLSWKIGVLFKVFRFSHLETIGWVDYSYRSDLTVSKTFLPKTLLLFARNYD